MAEYVKRYSQANRPAIGQICYLYPEVALLADFSKSLPNETMLLRPYLCAGAKCTVINNTEHIVEVRFCGQDDTDFVSPEFLSKCKRADEKDEGQKC